MARLRVLYAAFHPIPVSESYIRNEIEWMERHDVEIAIWARYPRLAAGFPDENHQYWLGPPCFLRDAIRQFRPAVVHAHPLFIGEMITAEVARMRLPLTVRGHVGFGTREPGDAETIRRLAARRAVARIWLFPHIAAEVGHSKVHALPACYAARHFKPAEPNAPLHDVLRMGTALPGKGWEEFLDIARASPDVSFVAALAVPDTRYADRIEAAAPGNVRFFRDLQREACVQLMQTSRVYLRGHDPASHRYGMPISIAEAMGCGLPVIARDAPEARRYIGPAGLFYTTPQQASALVRECLDWTTQRMDVARADALSQARHYADETLLPQVLNYWLERPSV